MAAVALSETNLEWLRELPGEVAANDLDETYGFEHPLNGDRQLTRESLATDTGDANLLWWVQFRTSTQQDLLEAPLARKIYRNTRLRSARENGPVAHNALLQIKESFKRRGFAASLYAAEHRLYKKWGVKEIQIDARDEGLVVWIKKFGFLPLFPKALALAYIEWARQRQGVPKEPPVSPADYPSEFLHSRDTLELYKVIS